MYAPKFRAEQMRRFVELHKLYWTYRAMAKALGVQKRTLTKWRAELNLPRRSRGRRKGQ